MKYNFGLLNTIKEFGKDLISIDLLIVGANDTFTSVQDILDLGVPEDGQFIYYIIEGCPKLKSLTLESLRGWAKESPKAKMSRFYSALSSFGSNQSENLLSDDLRNLSEFWNINISEEALEALREGCKELKDLKLTKVTFEDILTEDEIKKILPECNVEINDCEFPEIDDSSWMSHDSYDSDLDDLFENYDSDNSWDVSFEGGEQDSNSERSNESDENKTMDILDNFDGDEFELMFSENYGEDNKDENEE